MNRIFTATDIVRNINALPKNRLYGYLSPKNHGEIQIIRVETPEGPIIIRRRQPGGSWGEEVSMSSQMIWRLANALNSKIPINVDRVLGGSYNTRSVLEALVALIPEVYTCHPGRQEINGDQVQIVSGHKHIMWRPDAPPHQLSIVAEYEINNAVISEIPTIDLMYDVVPVMPPGEGIDIEIKRRHAQIQVALAEIARALDMRTWLAVQDHGIVYNGRRIVEYDFIVKNLAEENAISTYPNAIRVARNIGCIYFNGGAPFAFEVEHSTGVTSGLTRMLDFKTKAEHLNTRYVIVAPDSDREQVLRKSSQEHFRCLQPLFFPYSQVEELYSFFNRHNNIQGLNRDFLLTFMEKAI